MTINDFKKVIVRDYRHAPQNTPLRLPIVGRCCAILRMAPLCNGYGLVQRWLAQDQLGFVKKKRWERRGVGCGQANNRWKR